MDETTENTIPSQDQWVANWGMHSKIKARVFEPLRPRDIQQLGQAYVPRIARGNGRCYGDSSLQTNIVSTLKLNRFLYFNPEKKVLTCESGVLLSDILSLIVPKACFLPVVPGTRFITIGGALAANIHGKNHYYAGSIARYIFFLDLIREDGKEIRCSASENPKLFADTIGGMGLTGIITRVSIQLQALSNVYLEQKGESYDHLASLCDQLLHPNSDYPYTVAWIDGLSKKGRGVLMSARNCLKQTLPEKLKSTPYAIHSDKVLNIPPLPSGLLLNRWVLSIYNQYYYRFKGNSQRTSILHYSSFFFPLDKLANWNRLYGPKGLLQYQFVLPVKYSKAGLLLIWKAIQDSSCRPFLAVLKVLGDDMTSVSAYSFPLAGLSLALDFKVNLATFELLEALDEIVIAHYGRIYLVKDARMKAKTFQATYQKVNLPEGVYQSLQSKRLKENFL